MVSLQLLVDRHRNTGIQKQLRKPGQAPRETIGKKVSKNGVDLGIWVAWIWRGFFGTGKKGSKNPRQIHASFRNRIRTVFAGIHAQIRAAKSKNLRRAPTLVPSVLARSGVLSSRTERPLANALPSVCRGRVGCTKMFWIVKTALAPQAFGGGLSHSVVATPSAPLKSINQRSEYIYIYVSLS